MGIIELHAWLPGWLTVPRVLCPQWRSMSKPEQAKYYMMAKKEKQLHAQQYPNWSAVHNYVRGRRTADDDQSLSVSVGWLFKLCVQGKKRRYDRSRGKALPRADHEKDWRGGPESRQDRGSSAGIKTPQGSPGRHSHFTKTVGVFSLSLSLFIFCK